MATQYKRFVITCIGITPLLLIASTPSKRITGAEIPIVPRATYLRTNSASGALNATPVDLSTLSIVAGERLRLEQLGDFDCGGPCGDDRTGMIGVFSSDAVLLGADQLHRVPGAVEAGQEMVTAVTHYGGLATDIPEDFQISNTTLVTPVGATYLFIAAHDSLYYDNTDPDSDFAVRITVVPELTGDYDDNGFVAQADLDLVLLNWGDDFSVDPIPSEWVNQIPPGLVAQEALDNVLLNWGSGVPPIVSVPEPIALWFLMPLMFVNCRTHR